MCDTNENATHEAILEPSPEIQRSNGLSGSGNLRNGAFDSLVIASGSGEVRATAAPPVSLVCGCVLPTTTGEIVKRCLVQGGVQGPGISREIGRALSNIWAGENCETCGLHRMYSRMFRVEEEEFLDNFFVVSGQKGVEMLIDGEEKFVQ